MPPQLAFMTTTSDSFRQIQLWTQYHRALGVELFYLFVDGQVRRSGVIISDVAENSLPSGVEIVALGSCHGHTRDSQNA